MIGAAAFILPFIFVRLGRRRRLGLIRLGRRPSCPDKSAMVIFG
jgi:hypothetical protein